VGVAFVVTVRATVDRVVSVETVGVGLEDDPHPASKSNPTISVVARRNPFPRISVPPVDQ
jgi:hypothetical protein